MTWLLILVEKMAEKCKDLIEEQLVYCKVRALLGISPSDIKADLDVVYGDAALKYATITKWLCRFKEGRTDFKDEPRPVRPLSAVLERDIENGNRRRCATFCGRDRGFIWD